MRPLGSSSALLSLVGEEEIAVRRESEVVEAFEALTVRTIQDDRHLGCVGVEGQETVAVVGNEDPAVLVDLQAIGLHAPLAGRRDLEDARMGEIDAK